MAKSQPKLLSFNGGVVSPLAFARQDSQRVALSAEQQTNLIPRRIGPMGLRPGTELIAPIITKFTVGTLTVDVGGNKTLSSSTGLANNATVYTANLSWGGFPPGGIAITVTGSAAQTYATLLSAIYDDISAASSLDEAIEVYLEDGNIVFADRTIGNDPEFTLTDGSPNALFATLGGTIGPNVPGTTDEDSDSKLIPFVFSKEDTSFFALVEGQARVIVDDDYINPASFNTTLRNGSFLYNLTNWTDSDDSGCTSSWVAGSDGKGRLSLVGTGSDYARRNQFFDISDSDKNKTCQFRVIVERGIVDIKCGSAAGTGDYFSGTFGAGCHWISFEPADDFYVELSSSTKYASLVDSVYFTSNGLLMETDYTEDDFPLIRHAQSGNVVYLACADRAPRKIERRSEFSYSFAEYLPDDGPFLKYNATGITMSPSALSGDITLTASKEFFQSGHVGALFLVDSIGQKVSTAIGAQNTFTNPIRLSGTTRSFFITISSIGSNTVTLQRSIGDTSSWTDVPSASYTTNKTNLVFDDSLDNQIIYYRIGIKTGDYVGGTTTVTLEYSQGSISGICRIVGITSTTVASAIVLREFGGTAATVDWREGAWSEYRGYPSSNCLYEGRLWWFGKQFIDGSASDEYETFDDTLEGAGRPIRRSIGYGSADNINWAIGAKNLIISTDTRALVARSSNDDTPLTQDDFSLKDLTSQGAARVNPVLIDSDVVYVQNAGSRIMRLAWDGFKYIAIDMTEYSPEVCQPSITCLAVQHQPDVRIHCVLSDGTTVVVIYDPDPTRNRHAFIPVESTGASGLIEDVIVLPGDIEDRVYYIVKREIPDSPFATDAGVVRLIEKWALESECQGGALNKQLDSFVTYSGVSKSTITTSDVSLLNYIEGQQVYVWGDGTNKVQGPFTVSGGSLTLTYPVTSAVIGYSYSAPFKSVKIGQLMDKKTIPQVGLVMRNVHPGGVEIGQDFDHMVGIPKADWNKTNGVPDQNLIIEEYHQESIPINSTWTMDTRLCLRLTAPYPATILAAVLNQEQNEK